MVAMVEEEEEGEEAGRFAVEVKVGVDDVVVLGSAGVVAVGNWGDGGGGGGGEGEPGEGIVV